MQSVCKMRFNQLTYYSDNSVKILNHVLIIKANKMHYFSTLFW